MVKIVFLFLIWRLLLFLPLTLADGFLTNRSGYGYTLLTYFLGPESKLLSHFLLYPFGNFDGVYYLIIAAKGYTVNAGFFPLFPLSISLVSSLFGPSVDRLPFDTAQYCISITLVSLYFLTSLILMFKLIKLDYKKGIALSSIIFLLIFPTSFFYASIYSESLFLFLSLLTFYFARKKKWLIAGIFGALLSATRLVGIAILPSLLYEYFKEEKKRSIIKILSLFIAPFGLLGYMFYNLQKWGNPFYFIIAQGNFQNNREVDRIVLLPQTILRYFKIFVNVNPNIYEFWVAILELSFFVFSSILLFIAWKKRIRFSYILFGVLLITIPASSGTLSGIPRYILPIFPIFIALSLIKNKQFRITYSIMSVILLILLFALFSKGYFVA